MTRELREYINDYPDFPGKGVVFRDISPLLADSHAFSAAIDTLAEAAKTMPEFDKIVAIDARGFIFGGALAERLGKGLVMCRKADKLPGEVITNKYGYEYSSSSLSVQKAAVKPGDRFLIVDDVLASGNTLLVTYKLLKELDGEVVGVLCLLELKYLDGRELLEKNMPNVGTRTILQIQK